MILNERYGFAFVHIPKCAGTTVREQLHDLDETGGAFAAVHTHPVLGRVDHMHLPLGVLAEHFPDIFARLERLDGFAITRDPMSRFRSSVAQHVKHVTHRRLDEVSAPELEAAIDDAFRHLEARPAVPAPEHVHFVPQCDYIRLDGRKVVQNTIPLENISALLTEIAHRTGRQFDTAARSNQSFALRYEGLRRAIWRANDIGRAVLPYGAYQALKRRALPLVVRDRAATEAETVFRSDRVTGFVRDYYADDFRQHADDLARAEARPAEDARARASGG